jgi:hypothetical protein
MITLKIRLGAESTFNECLGWIWGVIQMGFAHLILECYARHSTVAGTKLTRRLTAMLQHLDGSIFGEFKAAAHYFFLSLCRGTMKIGWPK